MELSGTLAAFLAAAPDLEPAGDPPVHTGVPLEPPGDLSELIDAQDMDPLPGSHRRRQAIGYFAVAAGAGGLSAGDAAAQPLPLPA